MSDPIGNPKTKKVHKPFCPWARKIRKRARVHLGSYEEARRRGFRYCKHCKK